MSNKVNVKTIPLTTLEGIASTQAFAGNAKRGMGMSRKEPSGKHQKS